MERRFINSTVIREVPRTAEPLFKLDIKEVTPIDFKTGLMVFGTVVVVGTIVLTAAIGTQIFFGVLMLGGFVALVESNKYLKWAVAKSSRLVDIAIFCVSMYAMFTLGLTMTGGLTVFGLGYTLVVAPYVRKTYNRTGSNRVNRFNN